MSVYSASLFPFRCNIGLIPRTCFQLQSRTFKSELKIKWVRPTKIPCTDPVKSGDLKSLPHVDPKKFPSIFEKSEEFNSASDAVKILFSFEFNPRMQAMQEIRYNMVHSVRRHTLDNGSMECTIAKMTGGIRDLQDYLSKCPRNKRIKVQLKELIDKRKKFLKYLRRWDYKRFEWLLERLDLEYRPPPNKFHRVTRKESLVKLTDKYCNDLKEERLKAYKENLESMKQEFLEEKIKKLKWIMEEEVACGVKETVIQSDIDKVRAQLENFKLTRVKE